MRNSLNCSNKGLYTNSGNTPRAADRNGTEPVPLVALATLGAPHWPPPPVGCFPSSAATSFSWVVIIITGGRLNTMLNTYIRGIRFIFDICGHL